VFLDQASGHRLGILPDSQRIVPVSTFRIFVPGRLMLLVFRPRSPVFVHSNYSFVEGVVDQIIDGEDDVCNAPIKPCDEDPKQALCQERWRQQIDVYQVDAPLSIGPVFARHLGHRMYRGEYYCTQSDAHVTFTQNWDEDALLQMESTHNEMAVLSTYLTDIQGSIDPETGASKRHTRPIMCNTHYEGGAQGMHLRHGSQPERNPSIHGMPQLQPWWAAGYSFSRGHFAVNVPYDPISPMIFQVSQIFSCCSNLSYAARRLTKTKIFALQLTMFPGRGNEYWHSRLFHWI
jgi:hypothetical protein